MKKPLIDTTKKASNKMPQSNESGNGNLAEIVNQTAEESERLAFASARDEKDDEDRFGVYSRRISEELKKDNVNGALSIIQRIPDDDPYCQASGYLVLRRYHQEKQELDKAREMIDLSLRIADNSEGNERDKLYKQIVGVSLAMEDENRAESLTKEIKNPYHQSQAYLSLIIYQFSRKKVEKAKENLELVVSIARKIENGNDRAEIFYGIITKKLAIENRLKEALELAHESSKHTYYRNLSFRDIIFYKLRKNNLSGIKELLDEIDGDNNTKAEAVTAIIEKEAQGDVSGIIARTKDIANAKVRAQCQNNFFSREIQKGNLDGAEEIAGNIEDIFYKSATYLQLLSIRLSQKDIPKAEELLKNIKEGLYKARSLVLLSRALYNNGEKEAAKERLEEAARFTKEECNEIWRDNLFREKIIPAQIYFEEFDKASDSVSEIKDLFWKSDVYIKLALKYTEREEFMKAVDTIRLGFEAAEGSGYGHLKASRLLDISNACRRIAEELEKRGEPVPKILEELLKKLGKEAY